MEHFYRRIAQKAADFAQAPVLIVALGDSITQGAMAYQTMNPERVYHRFLQQRLQEAYPLTTFSTINAGVSGSTAPQALQRLERDVISHHPDLVLIAFGANDCLGGQAAQAEFSAALTTMIGQVRARTEADIVLLTPPMMANRHTDRIHPEHETVAETIIRAQTNGDLAAYADIVRAVAAQEEVPLADVHQAWQNLAKQGVDTITWLSNALNHPDEHGQRMAADILWECLQSAHPARQPI